MDGARWREGTDKVMAKREKRQVSEAEMESGMQGRRQEGAEDTAAMEPLMCQISHARDRKDFHPVNLALRNKEKNTKKKRKKNNFAQ